MQKGKIVILGGTIARLENLKNGTLIEVIEKKLDFWGKPRRRIRAAAGSSFSLLVILTPCSTLPDEKLRSRAK
jgi:starvation-inducible outer membrane lipoprotein